MDAALRHLLDMVEICRHLEYHDYINQLLDAYWQAKYDKSN